MTNRVLATACGRFSSYIVGAACILFIAGAGVPNRLSAAESLATIEVPAAKQTLQIVRQLPPPRSSPNRSGWRWIAPTGRPS